MSSPEDLSEVPEEIILSERDSELFLNALENPREPNEALIKLMRDFRKGRGVSEK